MLHTFGYPEPEIFGFLYVHPGPRRLGGHLRALVVRQSRAHLLPLPAALDAASVPVAVPEGRRSCARWGAKIAAGIGPARRAASWRATATRASAKARAAPTCSPVRAWTRPGPPARNWPKRVLELLKAGKPLHQGESGSDLRGAAARQLGGRGRPVAEKSRDGFQRGVIPGLLGMALAGLTEGKLSHRPASRKRMPTLGGVLPRDGSQPRRSPESGRTAAHAASAATTR